MEGVPPDDTPQTLRFEPTQPYPSLVIYAPVKQGPFHTTAIARTWANGDEARCRLCSECNVTGGQCLVNVPWHVPRESAALFAYHRTRPGKSARPLTGSSPRRPQTGWHR